MLVSPDNSLSNGNWTRGSIIIARKISPNIVANLFVGMSCFGIDFPIIFTSDSSPAYLYFGFNFFIGLFTYSIFCVGFGVAFFVIGSLGIDLDADLAAGLFTSGGVNSFTVDGVTSFSGILIYRFLV